MKSNSIPLSIRVFHRSYLKLSYSGLLPSILDAPKGRILFLNVIFYCSVASSDFSKSLQLKNSIGIDKKTNKLFKLFIIIIFFKSKVFIISSFKVTKNKIN